MVLGRYIKLKVFGKGEIMKPCRMCGGRGAIEAMVNDDIIATKCEWCLGTGITAYCDTCHRDMAIEKDDRGQTRCVGCSSDINVESKINEGE